MDKQLKLVDYSDSESETEEESPAVLHGAETFSVRDSQGRQVAIVEPTPQNVAVVHPMDSSAEEDLEGSRIFEPDVNDPLSTQATHGSSSPADEVDPYFISQEIAESLDIEIPRGDVEVIVISDSSQDTIIISEPREAADCRSDTSGDYALVKIFLVFKQI